MNKEGKKRILLTGGGTGGSVAPLLAVAEELKVGGEYDFFWLGTKFGPEREMVGAAGIKFKAIAAGKWRRYFSFKNIRDLFSVKLGFWQALLIMLKRRPSLVMSAGSFASVPVVWAAWCLGVPVLIHQQDVLPGLANRLMAPLARVITVTFEKSLADYGRKAVWTGNPIRKNFQFPILNFQFNSKMPVLLVLGGGTGAKAINDLVEKSLDELIKFCQVIHVLGKNKTNNLNVHGYAPFEFLGAEKMAAAMRAAELVITRAGLSTLSELSYLSKPAIIIPLPESHQEANAEYFKNKQAVVAVRQKDLTPANFARLIKGLLADKEKLARLAANMGVAMRSGANEEMAKIIEKMIL